jgi:hypothetical protein
MENAYERKEHTTFRNRQITDLSQVPRINITPSIPLPRLRSLNKRREIPFILMRLNHITNSQRIYITLEPPRKRSCRLLATNLGKCISSNQNLGGESCDYRGGKNERVFWINIIVFFERERMIVCISLGETDAVDGF